VNRAALRERARRVRFWTSRWGAAELLNRLPWTCWASLVSWALDRDSTGRWFGKVEGRTVPRHLRYRLRDTFDSATCRAEAADPLGCCYCAKFRGERFGAATATTEGTTSR
jgi:hypothetical protein